MNLESNPNVQAGHLPVGIMPVPPDAPDPTELDWPLGHDTRLEVKGDLPGALNGVHAGPSNKIHPALI
jgi:hypothetical protein